MVTGPMPRNPNATRPNANTAGATIRAPTPRPEIRKAPAISAMIAIPSQKAEKLPATSPERMFSEAPPWLELFTTSSVCTDDVEVNTFTSSGISAPARVPQETMVASFHHSVPSPRSGISRYEVK